MRAYVGVTGAVFALLTLAHVWRAIVETNILRDPWWMLITVVAAVLCLWACRLLWRPRRS